ncbi:cell division protein FtsQ/DivIB [Nitrosovibrio sp. Nv4]|uniref:cell division protein FtsQ/DivIB n=1 Tax=Nitrosovibrio sp. Nv4 TaxID=1945880 RepID=UPI000BCCAD28|nr:cell division protein FtsQ/DivIB [Nitrosovibrio sp. Nv4]SOD39938.1 cell division protein FtsQ [Nitrosovibrio sp. Nv4]
MWDNHQTLDFLSSWLFVVAVLIAGCLISQWAINLPVFPLQEMTVRGSGDGGRLRHVTREQIDNVVRSEIMGNFLTVDLEATRKAFSKLPWVRAASVRRTWPKGLDVTLEEHVARARWGSDALVGTRGEIFNAASNEKLPVFEGPMENSGEMVRQYAAFSKLLRRLQQNIEQISLSPRGAWRIRLENGAVLELGREQMEPRLARYVLVHERSVAQLNQRLSYVDLRYPDGFAAR